MLLITGKLPRIFSLPPGVNGIKGFMISSHGMAAICAEAAGQDKEINKRLASSNMREAFESTQSNVKRRWAVLIIFSFVFALVSIIFLERIDKDKR